MSGRTSGRPTTTEELESQMQRSGVSGSRLKNAPTLHYWEIGEQQRVVSQALNTLMASLTETERQGRLTAGEKKLLKATRKQFDDPDINTYTHAMLTEDEKTQSKPFLYICYHYEEAFFVLDDPKETTDRILSHFHPMNWPEFAKRTDWEVIREVIPPMQAARISLKTYEEQRYLYDERAQRAAETLAWRIVHLFKGQVLPERYTTFDDSEREVVDTYAAKLERGQNPRRWWQEKLNKVANAAKLNYQQLRGRRRKA